MLHLKFIHLCKKMFILAEVHPSKSNNAIRLRLHSFHFRHIISLDEQMTQNIHSLQWPWPMAKQNL